MGRLAVNFGDRQRCVCSVIIAVPQQALAEPGYIRALTEGDSLDKHAVQALAQTAFYRYQDDELEVVEVVGICRIDGTNGAEEVEAGLILYRQVTGEIGAVAQSGLNIRKLLETAHRYCTRWVRLDL